jgi:hypothetical protein
MEGALTYSRVPAPGAPGCLRLTTSTDTVLDLPWEKLWRTVPAPASAGFLRDSVDFPITLRVLSPVVLSSVIQFVVLQLWSQQYGKYQSANVASQHQLAGRCGCVIRIRP